VESTEGFPKKKRRERCKDLFDAIGKRNDKSIVLFVCASHEIETLTQLKFTVTTLREQKYSRKGNLLASLLEPERDIKKNYDKGVMLFLYRSNEYHT
jgi:hypothetical protein